MWLNIIDKDGCNNLINFNNVMHIDCTGDNHVLFVYVDGTEDIIYLDYEEFMAKYSYKLLGGWAS